MKDSSQRKTIPACPEAAKTAINDRGSKSAKSSLLLKRQNWTIATTKSPQLSDRVHMNMSDPPSPPRPWSAVMAPLPRGDLTWQKLDHSEKRSPGSEEHRCG